MFRRNEARTSIRRAATRLALEQLEDRLCPSDFTIVATGLNNPRGLTFGPDGQRYVAQGGPATNTLTTTGDPTVQQVPFPIGPYSGGYNSSISRINPITGAVTTVVSGLPSSQTNPVSGSLVSGVSDVKFLGDTLYGIEAGAGSSHGLAGTDNTIFRVNPDGTTTTVADLSAFQKANPVVNPNADDFEPDGTWYSMVAVRGDLYAVEPNHGELDKITPNGQISRVLDFSAVYGHVVPTAVAYHGNFYVGNLGTFPINPGSENIYKVTPSGQTKVAAPGLTTVVGVAFDAQGQMYALESFTHSASGFPDPSAAGTGEVVRVNHNGTLTPIATGLTFPTAMTFGPDGNLYVSNVGFGVPVPGAGQIVRIDMASARRDAADHASPEVQVMVRSTSEGISDVRIAGSSQTSHGNNALGQPVGATLDTTAPGETGSLGEMFLFFPPSVPTGPTNPLSTVSQPSRSLPPDGTTGLLQLVRTSHPAAQEDAPHQAVDAVFEALGAEQPF
jgi:hypothetical protein